MKFLPLLWANLTRHKRRTVLTVASVALALFLFASLRTVVTTIARNAAAGSAQRLVVQNATGLVFPLPLSYANRLATVSGVTGVSYANWFGGRYGDGKRFFANFAVDPATYLDLYPELQLPPDQREAFLHEKTSAIVGQRLLEVFGWRLGQDVTLQGTIFPGDWTLTIRGVYTPANRSIGDDMLLFHHDYLDERIGRAGIVGWYILRIANADAAPQIAKTVDDQYRSSSSPTKTGTEKAFQAGFATMWGNVSLLMNTIGMAVVFAILLVTANAMMMSARERTKEVAVLKTVGFSDGRLFGLVMLETGIITLAGAAAGLGGAKLLYRATNFNAAGFLPGFDVSVATLVLGTSIAFLLMLASGLVPAMRAARLPVVQGLRTVE
ncbi:MAG TPA: FtsX-like permease family protein [Gemmatimonadales bacterium]|nr:FtsX-like permease family protein [Gemmatimonadales bacterium]